MALCIARDASEELLNRIRRGRHSGNAILASLQSVRVAVARASTPDLIETERTKEESLRDLKRDSDMIQLNKEKKAIFRDPKTANLVFLSGKTLGCYLKENLSPADIAILFQEIGISRTEVDDFLQDKIPTKKEVDTKLFKYLNDKVGLSFVDYTLYKANAYKKGRS